MLAGQVDIPIAYDVIAANLYKVQPLLDSLLIERSVSEDPRKGRASSRPRNEHDLKHTPFSVPRLLRKVVERNKQGGGDDKAIVVSTRLRGLGEK